MTPIFIGISQSICYNERNPNILSVVMASANKYHEVRKMFDARATELHTYPEGRFTGKGIVIVGGGVKYFASSFALISVLQKICSLPIEFWYFGTTELDDEMLHILSAFERVTLINAEDVLKKHPSHALSAPCPKRPFYRFELKAYALIHSQFQEVLYIDADSIPLSDPSYLFQDDQYRSTGALLWRDPLYGPVSPSQEVIQKYCGLKSEFLEPIESGHLLFNKRAVWNELMLVWAMNEESSIWFSIVYGDKDLYTLAWHKLGRTFLLCPSPVSRLAGVVQPDPDGEPLFFHHWFFKPGLHSKVSLPNSTIENLYNNALRSLRKLWSGTLWPGNVRFQPGWYELRFDDGKIEKILVTSDSSIYSCQGSEYHHFGSGLQDGSIFLVDLHCAVMHFQQSESCQDWIGCELLFLKRKVTLIYSRGIFLRDASVVCRLLFLHSLSTLMKRVAFARLVIRRVAGLALVTLVGANNVRRLRVYFSSL